MATGLTTGTHGNLPAELTGFIGRRRELADIRRLMSGGRLVTLVGTGGVGKTRLSREVAKTGSRGFSDSTWLVELADLRQPGLLVPAVAAALGLREQTETWDVAALGEWLRSRHILIILDNCEHLVAAVADVVDRLLHRCPQLHVLATSREPLGLLGERVYPVLPLPLPEQGAMSARELAANDAVALLVQRAVEVCPEFELTDATAPVVAALCHRLDGVPLALEMAACWLRTLSSTELLARLSSHFELLHRAHRGAPARQQSLRSMVDWSYQLCTTRERRVWRAAAVFVQGFSLESLGSVLGDLDMSVVLDAVDGLVAKSVLLSDVRAEPVRFRMLEIIRDHGLDRLREAREDRAVRVAHRDWCITMARSARENWLGPDQVTWFSRLRRELPNIRAAVHFSLTQDGGAHDVVDIVASLTEYWLAMGFLSEVAHWLDQAQSHDLQEPTRLRALRTDAFLATVRGDRARAGQRLAQARSLAEAGATEEELAWLTFASALAAVFADLTGSARQQLDDAERRFRATGDLNGLVWALCASTLTEATSDHPNRTSDRFARYLEATESHGERWIRSYALWAVAFAQWRGGRAADAVDLVHESLRLQASFDDDFALGHGLELLAWIVAAEGRPVQAAELLGRADAALVAAGSSVEALRYLHGHHRRCVYALQEVTTEDRFRAAFERGRKQDLAAFSVLVGGGVVAALPVASDSPASPLTRRQEAVAELVSEGLSNKQIATRLLISVRTVETHVEHMLVKLGYTSRTQLARWVTDRRA